MRNKILILAVLLFLPVTSKAESHIPLKNWGKIGVEAGQNPESEAGDCGDSYPTINITPKVDGSLHFSIYSSNGGNPPDQCEEDYDTMEAFIADRPYLYSKYIRNQVFAFPVPDASPCIAWQLFLNEYEVPSELRDEFFKLVSGLNAKGWKERDNAFTTLSNQKFVPLLLTVKRFDFSPEQNLSIDRLLLACPRLTPEQILSLRFNKEYLIDLLPYSKGDLRNLVHNAIESDGPL